jgi:predicted alpha/beta-fold hydrolase
MPFVTSETFRPSFFIRNGHLQTIWSQYRKVAPISYTRERIETPDGDFLDLDWSRVGGRTLAILVHGLEGHSYRAYMRGMVGAFNRRGIDTVSLNLRGCSGEPNRLLRLYHHGSSDDLYTTIKHTAGAYRALAIAGFSLGGNVALKYLGEQCFPIPPAVRCAVAISTPCDLTTCAWNLARPTNWIYMRRFLQMLHVKIRLKMAQFPGRIDDAGFDTIRTFKQFDDRYTAPLHGFTSAEDYWTRCASGQFLAAITTPSLLINARNDPFLTPPCFPVELATGHRYLTFEAPRWGGHVGFIEPGKKELWSETRAAAFVAEHCAH